MRWLYVMSELRDLFLRAHTVKVRDSSKLSTQKSHKDQPDKWPKRALIFDTETRTTVDQTLILLIWRLCKLVGDQYLCVREGIVRAEQLKNTELNALRTFVTDTLPDVEVKSFPPKMKLE